MKVSSSDVIETSIKPCADEVDPFSPHSEEVGSPLSRKEESPYFKEMDSKQSSNFFEGEDVNTGLGSILRLQ